MRGLGRTSLGISLRGAHARWVQVTTRLGRVRVLDAGTLPELPRRPARVIAGLPRRSVVLRWLERPDVDDAHLAGLLAYEIEGHFPFPADEVVYSFQKFARRGSRAPVLLVGARRDDIVRMLEPVASLALEPAAVDVTSLAAASALLHGRHPPPGQTLCLVDVDGQEAEVSAVRDGVLVSSRALSLGDDGAEAIVGELRRALAPSPAPDARIFVHGAGVDLERRLSEALGVTIEAWGVGGTDVDPAALGLALTGLGKVRFRSNLLPPERRKKTRERAVSVTVALLSLVGALAVGLAVAGAYRERHASNAITSQLAEARTRVAEVEEYKAEAARLEARLRFLDDAALERQLPLRVLRELASVLPPDAVLTELTSDGPRVQLRGSTISSPAALISALEQSTLFENAAFTSPISPQADRQGFHIQVSRKAR